LFFLGIPLYVEKTFAWPDDKKRKKKKNDLGGALTTSLLFIWLSAHIPSLWPRHLTLTYAFFFFFFLF
jgi:hypothetical protein